MDKFKIWVEAMRLRTLPVSVAGVVAACGLSMHNGAMQPVVAILCLAFAVLAQVASNFANEYFDYRDGIDAPGRQGPRRGVTEGDITPSAMLVATLVVLFLASVAGCALLFYGPWWLLPAGVGICCGALAYSTGPYPLSRHGLGELAVILFFGVVPVTLVCRIMDGAFSDAALMLGVAVGLMGANVLIINNYRDAEADAVVGKRTLAVILGARAMPWLYRLNAVVAGILVLVKWWYVDGVVWLSVIYMLSANVVSRVMKYKRGHALTPLLGVTSLSMLAFAVAFAVMLY